MNKFPLLEQMRYERDQREANITKPYMQRIFNLNCVVDLLERDLKIFKKVHSAKITDYVHNKAADILLSHVMQELTKAVEKTRFPYEPVVVQFTPSDIAYLGFNRFANELMRQYLANVFVGFSPQSKFNNISVVRYDYRISAINVSEMVKIEV